MITNIGSRKASIRYRAASWTSTSAARICRLPTGSGDALPDISLTNPGFRHHAAIAKSFEPVPCVPRLQAAVAVAVMKIAGAIRFDLAKLTWHLQRLH